MQESTCAISLYRALTVPLIVGIEQATPTGLNNIPMADVVPKNVLVFQFISDKEDVLTVKFNYVIKF